jgi:hypothetical protein
MLYTTAWSEECLAPHGVEVWTTEIESASTLSFANRRRNNRRTEQENLEEAMEYTISEIEQFVDIVDNTGRALNKAELSTLWDMANQSLHARDYRHSRSTVEALLVQADRYGNVVPDYLPRVHFANMAVRDFQPLADRIKAVNDRVRMRTC